MAENKSDFSGVIESGASFPAAEMASCFTCFLRTDEFIRIIEAGDENWAAIFGLHFWFTRDEYYNRTVCTSCWTKIDDFHRFYSEVKSAHQQGLGPTKVEVKVELLEEDEGDEFNTTAGEKQSDMIIESLENDSETKVFAEPLGDPFDSDGSEIGGRKRPRKARKKKEKKTKSEKLKVEVKGEQPLANDSETESYADPLDEPPSDPDYSDTETKTKQPKKEPQERKPRTRVHKKPTFDCQLCREESKEQSNEKYSTYYSIKKHSLEVHGKSPVMYCPECDQQYSSETAFHRHSAKHRGLPVRTGKRKSNKTNICNPNPAPGEDLSNHNNNADPTPAEKEPLKPAEGDEFYYYQKRRTPEEVAEQDAVITKVVTLACTQCEYIADTFANFRKHGIQVHELKHVVMLCCQGRFSTRTSLYDHCVTHIDPDRFRCEPCARRFKSSDKLKIHNYAFHTAPSERPYQCTHCSKTFVKEYMLAKHMTYHKHQEEKTFSCHECDLVFTQKYRLRYHRIKVHGEPTQWLCDICAEPFAQQGPLKKHRVTHSPEELAKMMVQCEKCGKWLPNKCKRNTARHIKACTGGGGKSLAAPTLLPPLDDGMAMWFGASGLS